MVIVRVARGDLRGEYVNASNRSDETAGFSKATMADEAFALSPISARPTLPSEAEYEAISNAFMETSRGRWFLNEYARRNRNTDTRMVLDAVARIEQTLAAQKATPTNEPAETLAAIGTILDESRTRVLAAIADTNAKDALAPAYRGARTIREIAWTLRECGADQRICDSLDTQAKAIDAGLERLATVAPRETIGAVFDDLMQRIAELANDGSIVAAAKGEPDTAGSSPPPGNQPIPFRASSRTATTSISESSSPSAHTAVSPQRDECAGDVEAARHDDGLPETAVVSDASMPEDTDSSAPLSSTETAQDDAVLDIIAMEMAAPDPEEVALPLQAEAEPVIAQRPVTVETPPLATEAPAQPEPSLGAVLLARGAVRRPAPSSTNRFAAIRRLSQIEKIALFS